MRRRRVLSVLALMTFMASACGFVSDGAGGRVGSEGPKELSDALAWAGFTDIRRLQVVDARGEAGIDTLEMFLLRGSAEAVDRALGAAEFDAPPEAGTQVTQPPVAGFDPDRLEHVVAAEDRWENADGQTLQRLYVRGEEAGGLHLLHVWAFTT